MVSRKQGRLKRKDHAQDCETLSASCDQRPAILPWSLCFEWRPSFRWYGHLTRYAQPPDCCWTRRSAVDGIPTADAKTRARCARELYSTANVVLFEQSLVTRLILPLDVIEQRTACGDHLQKAAA